MWMPASEARVCSPARCDVFAFSGRLPPRSEAMCFSVDRRDVQRSGIARSSSVIGLPGARMQQVTRVKKQCSSDTLQIACPTAKNFRRTFNVMRCAGASLRENTWIFVAKKMPSRCNLSTEPRRPRNPPYLRISEGKQGSPATVIQAGSISCDGESWLASVASCGQFYAALYLIFSCPNQNSRE